MEWSRQAEEGACEGKKEKWSGGGEEEKRDSAASTLHLVLRLLDLIQNTGLLLVSGGQCLQPCLSRGDGGAVQLGSCARYDARRAPRMDDFVQRLPRHLRPVNLTLCPVGWTVGDGLTHHISEMKWPEFRDKLYPPL